MKDARTYIARVASNTDWETNGQKIAATLSAALQKDHTALHAAAEAARDMQVVSRDLTHKISSAADAQRDGSKDFHQAATRLLGVMEAHREGRWRRMGVMALIAALCGALGFFAREPASKYAHLREAGTALKQDAYSWACEGTRGESFTDENNGRSGCVIWEDPS